MSTAPHGDVRGRWLSSFSARRSSPASAGGIAAIEVVVVIAVTVLMVALAMSAYRTYSVRREVTRSLTAVAPIQALVTDVFRHTGVPPASDSDVPGLPSAVPSHSPIQAITIRDGQIEIRFGAHAKTSLRGRVLQLTPFESIDGQVVWICGRDPAGLGLYPLGFIGGTNLGAEIVTTVERRYLPAECR